MRTAGCIYFLSPLGHKNRFGGGRLGRFMMKREILAIGGNIERSRKEQLLVQSLGFELHGSWVRIDASWEF